MNALEYLGLAVTAIAMFGTYEHRVIKYYRSKTKNENVQLLLTWADQAVTFAEGSALAGSQKKKEAIGFVSQRLVANKLTGKFSDEQISAVIEQAVAQLNATNK